MRRTAILLNTALLCAVVFLVAKDGWPSEFIFQIIVLLFVAAPLVSIAALLQNRSQKSESWLFLLLERKRLEEKARIANLRKSGNDI